MSREQLAKDNGMTIEFVNWFFENKKDGCGNVWFMMMAAMWEGYQAATASMQAERDQLAAECAALKELIEQHAASFAVCPNCSHVEPSETDDIVALYRSLETTASDAFLREQMAKGVEMFAELQRSFIGKPSKNDAASSYCSREAVAFVEQIRRGVTK